MSVTGGLRSPGFRHSGTACHFPTASAKITPLEQAADAVSLSASGSGRASPADPCVHAQVLLLRQKSLIPQKSVEIAQPDLPHQTLSALRHSMSLPRCTGLPFSIPGNVRQDSFENMHVILHFAGTVVQVKTLWNQGCQSGACPKLCRRCCRSPEHCKSGERFVRAPRSFHQRRTVPRHTLLSPAPAQKKSLCCAEKQGRDLLICVCSSGFGPDAKRISRMDMTPSSCKPLLSDSNGTIQR